MNDLISRQAAIDETWKEPSYTDPYNVLTEVRERIQSLPSAQQELITVNIDHELTQEEYEKLRKDMANAPIMLLPSAQQWIPCSERSPDKEGNYLMTAQPTYNHAKDIRIAHWSGRWVGYVQSEILAWMPLPEPYKGEES